MSKDDIINQSFLYRGSILHECTLMERWLDACLASYFCKKETANNFVDLVLGNNRISLDGKRKLLENVFKVCRFDYKAVFPTYNSSMNTVMRERNFFAHNTTVFDEEAVFKSKNQIGLYRFGIEGKIHWYDIDKVSAIIAEIKGCADFFKDIATNEWLLGNGGKNI